MGPCPHLEAVVFTRSGSSSCRSFGETIGPPTKAVADELGLVKRPSTAGNATRSDDTPRERTGEWWHRTVLLPGLELFVSAAAMRATSNIVRAVPNEPSTPQRPFSSPGHNTKVPQQRRWCAESMAHRLPVHATET